jgi:tripartite-type tricarboxylate transporter receptor subunit TctC
VSGRRGALQGLAAGAAGLGLALHAPVVRAQAWPSRPLRLVVPFTPGGSTDILARALGQVLAESLGQPVVIENKPGAGGAIGAESVARAQPDGYTLLMGHIGTLAVNPSLYPKLGYRPLEDFATVALVADVPNVLAVHPGLPVKSVAELVALARAKPGVLGYASGGAGSAAHLAGASFALATRTELLHVPYRGTAPALTDLIGGQVAMTMTGLPPLQPHLKSGALRALGVAARARLPQLPEVPTVAEAGVPGFEATQWYGVVVPARTPRAIVDALAAQVLKALDGPTLRRRLEDEGAAPNALGPEPFRALIRAETERWAKVVKEADIRV